MQTDHWGYPLSSESADAAEAILLRVEELVEEQLLGLMNVSRSSGRRSTTSAERFSLMIQTWHGQSSTRPTQAPHDIPSISSFKSKFSGIAATNPPFHANHIGVPVTGSSRG